MNDVSTALDDDRIVFNMVWTDSLFHYFNAFLSNLLDHCGAHFRLVANRCSDDAIASMERYAEAHPDRIDDILVASTDELVPHGVALDEVRRRRDDGDHFCFIDPDILATGPFLPLLFEQLQTNVAVTTGRQVWSDGNVLPDDYAVLPGDYFFRSDGFVYGCSYCALYEVASLQPTLDRWSIGLGSTGLDLAEHTERHLASIGQSFKLYDTGKMVNILLQDDGQTFCQIDQPALLHIGGMSHYFSAEQIKGPDGELQPIWANFGGLTARFEVARYTAHVLQELCAGRAAPPLPPGANDLIDRSLVTVREALIQLLATYGSFEADGKSHR